MFKPLNVLQNLARKTEINESMEKYNFIEEASRVLPLVGYFMILMTIIDCLSLLVPSNFRNPEWELSVISSLSDQSWAFLIGMGFILTSFFNDSPTQIRAAEIRLIYLIRWFLLIWGIALLLSILLVISNTNRISNQIKADFSRQAQSRQELIINVETNLNKIVDKNQLLQISQTLGIPINNLESLSEDEIKLRIGRQISNMKENLPKQIDRAQTGRLTSLFSKSIRLGSQLIIIAVVNTLVWLKTKTVGSLLL
jgi:hypothetical protein